ncbi:N-acetyltransferase [Paractinoplanes abujensis]|uniref:GNAT superfamily N-acetyltransferase n=1 Tax=Paractinoplanes abujensis TaxID=882441 RepID=A0A7W7CSB1_9ACTN|nr:GNAT family N-acetyltransferase [Actinoplanes abujensis]MBB4692046.1 GNAT superfamily N-acetyltransferase [Actinoplanes abujensis]GID16537.1 N-acetyltransferase [Actinoplanes abujensis]
MTIARLDPSDLLAMSQWYDLMATAPDFLAPSRRDHLARFEHPWPGTTEQVLLARDGDQVVGAACCSLPGNGAASTVGLELVVHPQFRRRGIGSGLLAEVRAQHASLIEIQTAHGGAGYQHLVRRGHRPGMTSIRSRCRVAERPELDLTEAWSHARGYSLVQWRDAAPGGVVEDVAALQGRLMLDAPTGDLAVQPTAYDVARIRAQEATEAGRGHRSFSTAARHDATGRIVARTKLAFESDDDAYARQRITIVEPAHRGRRLGLIVKAANHAYARDGEPALRVVEAWNAEDNTPMRAVNAMLGFEPVDRWSVFQF